MYTPYIYTVYITILYYSYYTIYNIFAYCILYAMYTLYYMLYNYILIRTYVYRFPADHLDSRLNFIVVNMLTIVAFLIILGGMLPDIPYLTTVDKYTMFAFGFVLACAFCCVLFNYLDVEETLFEDWFYVGVNIFVVLVHAYLVYHYYRCRSVEMHKTTIDRHEVRFMTFSHTIIMYYIILL